MKLVRWGLNGEEKPGIWVDGKMLDVGAHIRDYDAAFFAGGGLQQLTAALETHTFPVLPANIRLGCPVANPSKIICVGLNYAKHAAETGAAVPLEPIIFLKANVQIHTFLKNTLNFILKRKFKKWIF